VTLPHPTTRTITPATTTFRFGLDKSSPYKNGGFLPLFNTLFNHAHFHRKNIVIKIL